jgi:glutamine amidotransferase
MRSIAYDVMGPSDPLATSDVLILPGVGTFGQGMDYLIASGLQFNLIEHAKAGGKIIGICLGMQMLLQASAETPSVSGLGLIPGQCERIPTTPAFLVPHIGWNSLLLPEPLHPALRKIGVLGGFSKQDFYFVHSFYVCPTDSRTVIARFAHPCGPLPAALAMDNIFGLQFHPEKSGAAGYALLDHILAS